MKILTETMIRAIPVLTRSRTFLGMGICAGLMFASAASASMINGSMGLSFLAPVMSGSNLATSTTVGNTAMTVRDFEAGCPDAASGDDCVVPTSTDFGSFSLNLATIASGGGLTFTNATYGTFTASFGEIVDQTANFLDVYLTGMYVGLPGNGTTCGGANPCDPSPTSFRASWTFTGNSLSGSGTLASPPAGIPRSGTPEPATMGLLGSALIGLGFIRRRRA